MSDAPRWVESQKAVEAALSRGPKSLTQIVDQTGLTRKTVLRAIDRADVDVEPSWPRIYTLRESAFDRMDKPQPEVETPEPVKAPQYIHIVEPMSFEAIELGPRWQENRVKLGREIGQLDLTKLSLKEAREHFAIEVASLLGVLVILRQIDDGPDWRDQIGLPV